MFLWLAGTPWLRRDSSKMSREICLKETLRDPVIVWALWKWAFVSPWHLTQEEDERKPESIGDIHRVAIPGHQEPPLIVSRVKHYPRVLSETTGANNALLFLLPSLTRYLLMPLSHTHSNCVHHWFYNSRDRFSMSRSRGGEELMFSLMDQESLSHNQEDQQ